MMRNIIRNIDNNDNDNVQTLDNIYDGIANSHSWSIIPPYLDIQRSKCIQHTDHLIIFGKPAWLGSAIHCPLLSDKNMIGKNWGAELNFEHQRHPSQLNSEFSNCIFGCLGLWFDGGYKIYSMPRGAEAVHVLEQRQP